MTAASGRHRPPAGPGQTAGPRESGRRRESRERALSLLYEAEAKDMTPTQLLGELPVAPDAFALKLVHGVEGAQPSIDGFIAMRSVGWPLDRMPVLDRILLRLAVYELLECPDVPAAVAISEAVELAKLYSTEDSSRFVNGVLGALAAALATDEMRVDPAG